GCLCGGIDARITSAAGCGQTRLVRRHHGCAETPRSRRHRYHPWRALDGRRATWSGCMKPVQERKMSAIVSREFRIQMEGYGLTTAEIHYHLPDHPSLLQVFVWQEYDLAPKFPELRGFSTTGPRRWR